MWLSHSVIESVERGETPYTYREEYFLNVIHVSTWRYSGAKANLRKTKVYNLSNCTIVDLSTSVENENQPPWVQPAINVRKQLLGENDD